MSSPLAQILSPTPENLKTAGEALRKGLVVGMPTETVYGLAGAAFNESALAKIFSAKERPHFDPLIVHVSWDLTTTPSILDKLVELRLIELARIPQQDRPRIELLLKTFWPGPLTLVLPKCDDVPDLATSGLPSVAIRMPRHPVARALIAAAGTPLAAPSANRFGRISPTSAQDVFAELGDRIGLIIDGGLCEVGLESTVIGFNGGLTLLRPGGVPAQEIEKVAGTKLSKPNQTGATAGAPAAAPGMLDSHYAPRKTLRLLPGAISELASSDLAAWVLKISGSPKRIGLIVQKGDPHVAAGKFSKATGWSQVHSRSLSVSGNMEERARGLFSTLRELDASDAEILIGEPCLDETGLGHAIGDRLKRASRN